MYELCKICGEKKATPTHVISAHGMKSFTEYKELINDPEFMKDVKKHKEERKEREEKEYHMSRLLIYHWYPKASSLTRLMARYSDHAKTNAEALNQNVNIDIHMGKTETIVGNVIEAEALMQNGWECVLVKGGHDRSPKEYHMKREY